MSKSSILDKVAFAKLNGVVLPPSAIVHTEPEHNELLVTLVYRLQKLKYFISRELYDALSMLDKVTLVVKAQDLLSIAEESLGAHVPMDPFYPNFPKQVMDASMCELYLNAILHYWTCGTWRPTYAKDTRMPLCEEDKEKGWVKIRLLTEKDVKEYFFKLLRSKDSVPESLCEFLTACIDKEWHLEYNGEIPFKETSCRIAAHMVKNGEAIDEYVNSSTDILRVMALLSDADVELKKKVRFKSLKRKTRRLLVSALEKNIDESDIKRYASLWKVAFHNLHVGEYGGEAARVASRYRKEKNVATFETIVAEAIKAGDIPLAISKLRSRPSLLARSLDKLLRDAGTAEQSAFVIAEFEKVVDKVETKILLQLLGHFKGREQHTKNKRVVFTAGSGGRALLAPPLKAMDGAIVEKVSGVIKDALRRSFAKRKLISPGSKVFVGPELSKILLPSQLASITEDKRSIGRGSRVSIDLDEPHSGKNVIRVFMHWIGRIVDLSSLFLSADLKDCAIVFYWNLKQEYAWHSGDIVNAPAPEGATEFIDVDIEKTLAAGVRYMVMDVRVYHGPTFREHEQCLAGYMLRKEPQSGEIFEPTTVKAKFDITKDCHTVVLCAFDLVTREMIWLDTNLPGLANKHNTLYTNVASSIEMFRAYLDMCECKVTIRELVQLHQESVGATMVDDPNDADFVVGFGHGDLDVYDFAKINSEWI